MGASGIESQRRINALGNALSKMKSSTNEACVCCDRLDRRAKKMDSLTSPAADTSGALSKASDNLGASLLLMKDAKEKFETIRNCEPAIERLHLGVMHMKNEEKSKTKNTRRHPFDDNDASNTPFVLTEKDVYAAGDSMKIIRHAYEYFIDRKHWRSTGSALRSLERVHQMGVSSMCELSSFHLIDSGPAVKSKHVVVKTRAATESAQETRDRLSAALQSRDLLRSIGEYEENQPVEARLVRELRGILEYLGSNRHQLDPVIKSEPPGLNFHFGIPAHKVRRTEKVGSGGYTDRVKHPLKTGFPQIDAYGEARKSVAFTSIEHYYRRLKAERKRNADKFSGSVAMDIADTAARDAVRCLEHAMVVVAGEKNVYRTVVTPSLTKMGDEDGGNEEISPFYRKACAAAYSHMAASVVDKTMDIIETVFLKECLIGHALGTTTNGDDAGQLSVRDAAAGTTAGLRMLDGVRTLGPSLNKLCDMPIEDGADEERSLAFTITLGILQSTVKNTARTLEILAKTIQDDHEKGKSKAKDARVANLTCDVVRAVRNVSQYESAYKSVTKRRELPWDPNVGDDAGELESFIRFLIMRLMNSLKGRAKKYTKHPGEFGRARSNMFMMNNTFYLRDELGPHAHSSDNPNDYRIESSWFVDKVNKQFETEKNKYLGHWEVLNAHLTSVEHDELEYQKNDNILSLDSGRLIKGRFSGFNEDFERIYDEHKELAVVDPRLRGLLQKEVAEVFLPLYRNFFERYSKIRFSKKHQNEYTKYNPFKIEELLNELYVEAE